METQIQKVKKVISQLEELKEAQIKIAKEDLIKSLKSLNVEVVDFDFKKSLLWNIKLKLTKPFYVSYIEENLFGFLIGKVFPMSVFMDRHENNYSAPDNFQAAKEWAEDLYDVLDTWMLNHGSSLQILLQETPKYPQGRNIVRKVKNRLKRYGKIGSLLIKIGLQVFGAGFFFLFFKTMESPNAFWQGAESDYERLKRVGSSQASWSILSSGVSQARVEAHIIRLTVNQLLSSLEKSPVKEEVYKHIGDNLQALPKHLSKMERSLDRTNYALITMGGDWYRQRLVHEDRETVELASKFNPMPIPSKIKEASFHKEAGWTDKISVFWDKLTNSTARYMEAIEDIKKGKYSHSDKQKLGKKFQDKLDEYKKVLFKQAEDALRKDLKGYNLFLKKFDPCNLSSVLITNKNNRKFTIDSLIKWAENKAELEIPLPHPDPQFEDLVFTLKEWDYFYGSKLKIINGEIPLDRAKAEYSLSKNISQFVNLGATKLRLLIEAIFEFLDASVIGILIVLLQSKSSIISYFSPGFFISLLITWMVSLLIVGWHRSKPNFKRFQRVGGEI